MAIGGVTSDELTDEEKYGIEQSLGLLPGTFAPYYDKLVAANNAKEAKDELTFQKSVMDMLDMVPEGEMIQIGDSLYEGTEQPDVFTIKEEDATGNVTAIGVDKVTGERLWEQNLGRIGKGFKSGTGTGTTAATAGDLYAGQLNSWIQEGELDADVMTASIQEIAYKSGMNLSVKDLNAIRMKAEELIGQSGAMGGDYESGDIGSDYSYGVESGIDPEGNIFVDKGSLPSVENIPFDRQESAIKGYASSLSDDDFVNRLINNN